MNYSDSEEDLFRINASTYPTTGENIALVKPQDRNALKGCLETASVHKIDIHVVSGGRNWGYGSRRPALRNSLLIDLSHFQIISNFNENLGCVRVEAGVTFLQLHNFLKEQRSRLFLNPPGSGPEASIIGNLSQRGILRGIEQNRIDKACNMEVFLPNGTVLNSESMLATHTCVNDITRWLPGPSLDGLFSQSNLGIVCSTTIWLDRAPRYWQHYEMPVEAKQLPAFLDASQELLQDDLLKVAPSGYNRARLLAPSMTNTVQSSGLTQIERFSKLQNKHAVPAWVFTGSLTASTPALLCSMRDLIEDSFSAYGLPSPAWDALNAKGHVFGWLDTSDAALDGVTFAKPFGFERSHCPDLDNCGLIWVSPIVPFTGPDIAAAAKLITEVFHRHLFEATISIQITSVRCAHVIASIVYDRDNEEEEKRALGCFSDARKALHNNGWPLYREPGIVTELDAAHSDYPVDTIKSLIGSIKAIVDPAGILAPRNANDAHASQTLPSSQ